MKNTLKTQGSQMQNKVSPLVIAALFSVVAPAFAQEKAAQPLSTSSLDKQIDSVAAQQWGVNVFGTLKGGIYSSKISKSLQDPYGPNQENRAFSQGDVSIEGRPSNEAVALAEFRVHQDWSRSYDEGPNLFQVRQMYFDGSFINKSVRLRVGDVYTKKSPLVLWDPSAADQIFEAEIFAQKHEENEKEQLVGHHNRALQGIDFGWNITPEFSINLLGARLRAPWWNTGIMSFATSPNDRYFGYGDAQFNNNGITGTLGFAWTKDRIKSTRSYNVVTNANVRYIVGEGINYEDNTVINVSAGYDTRKKSSEKQKINFYANADIAQSSYKLDQDTMRVTIDSSSGVATLFTDIHNDNVRLKEAKPKTTGTAFNLNGGFTYQETGVELAIDGRYIQNDAKFFNSMAQSSSYQPRSILNSQNTPDNVESGFDAFYDATYQMDAVTKRTHLEPSLDTRVYNGTNNWIRAAYEKTSWTNEIASNEELNSSNNAPSINHLAFVGILPNGYASRNRVGENVDLYGHFLGGSIEARVSATVLAEVSATINDLDSNQSTDKAKMNRMGGGALVHVNSFIDSKQKIDVSTSMILTDWKQNYTVSQKAKYDLKTTHLQLGVVAEVYPKLSLLAGYQSIKGTDKNLVTLVVDAAGNTVDQSILSGGLQYAVSPASAVMLDYTKITYKASIGNLNTEWAIPRLMYKLTF